MFALVSMKIAIGSDHRGFDIKERIIAFLSSNGHSVTDFGTTNNELPVDYPDFACSVATAIGNKMYDRGILICSTGIGMCIAANKIPGVRAALCFDGMSSEISRRHNDANIMCLSAHFLGEETIERMVKIWIDTHFDGGRHQRRIEKIFQIESSLENGRISVANTNCHLG